MKFISFFLLLMIWGCTTVKQKKDTQVLDFGLFSIEAPVSWSKVKSKGVDSYVGGIAIDDTDTLEFDLGWYSNSLTEYYLPIIERDMLKRMGDVDTTEFIIVESRRNVDPDKYKKTNVIWDTIDGRRAKIVLPRQSGIGMTGVYIDSLWQSGDAINKFNLYGDDLKPENESLVIQAFKTLKFHQPK